MTSDARNKIGIGLFAAAIVFLIVAIAAALWFEEKPLADPHDARQVNYLPVVSCG